jgi:tetratricopeptide (TPR) repeat protein
MKLNRYLLIFIAGVILTACANPMVRDGPDAPIDDASIYSDDDRLGRRGDSYPGSEALPPDGYPDGSGPSPDTAIDSLLDQANVAMTNEQWDVAAQTLERALRIEPQNALVWQRLANVRFSQGDFTQAVQLATKSNTLARSNHLLQRQNLALIVDAYERTGDVERMNQAQQQLNNLAP